MRAPRVDCGWAEVRDLTEADVRLALEAMESTLTAGLTPDDYARRKPSVSVWWRGELLACLGVFFRWPGVAIPWALIPPQGRTHRVMLHRTASRLLDLHIQRDQPHRLELELIEGEDAAREARWLAALGFIREYIKPDGGPHREPVACWARRP